MGILPMYVILESRKARGCLYNHGQDARATRRKHGDASLRSGAVLLVVLFVSMVVALLSMTVLVRASRQLVCAGGGVTRLKLDYCAEAGLVHAKTLLLHPQNVGTGGDGYWQGGDGLQIEAGDDYYNLDITRPDPNDRCTYRVQAVAYRLVDSDNPNNNPWSRFAAGLRLDPCIAYWAGAGATATLPNTVTINGDVYCAGALTSTAVVNGDVFAASFTGTSTGQTYAATKLTDEVVGLGFHFPDITPAFFSQFQTVTPAACNNPLAPFVPDGANPAGILYYDKALHGVNALALVGDVTITGTLVVDGDLTMRDGVVTISPVKNYPALVVNGNLTIQNAAQLNARGLVLANTMKADPNAANITITGALFVKEGGVDVTGYAGVMTVTSDPMLSAVKWYDPVNLTWHTWSPAADAFFKYVKRIP